MTALAFHAPSPTTTFTLPPESEATGPPERRGVARDGVRLLLAGPGGLKHRIFRELPDLLDPGDLLVVNTSGTLPAAVRAHRSDRRPALVHVSTPLSRAGWVVELRRLDGSGPDLDVAPGEVLTLPGDVTLTLTRPYPNPAAVTSRLWRARVNPLLPAPAYLLEHGRPIAYRYLTGDHPLADFQTVYASVPGSAEMASAGRPFTARLLVALMVRGVVVAPVVLHSGVSSPELHEPPTPERFEVPEATARLVETTAAAGRRVIAVGTTVVRALESAYSGGRVRVARGWTDLVLGPGRPARVVTGLITGLHAPEASHLLLLEAVAGPALVAAAYDEAVDRGYLWHEFGDSMLFLPDRATTTA